MATGNAKPRGLAGWQRAAATRLIAEHLVVGIRQETLAAACNLSTSAFTRGFTRSLGQTPHRWLLARRIARALVLMQDPSLALCDIALSVGFADQSHFSRVFARQLGTSPGAWRRERRRPAVAPVAGQPPACRLTSA